MMPMKKKLALVTIAAATVLSTACGDSSGPGSVDADGALQSLALGLQGVITGGGSPTTPDITTAFAGIAPLLTQAAITIDGHSQPMYAVGLRESFPEGTCEEDLFVDPAFPNEPGVCTAPSLNTALVFWQSHSAQEPPDRMLFVVADPGTVSFDFDGTVESELPAFAFYIEGEDNLWGSLSGALTSTITSLNQPCATELPPYAKSGTCNFASFDEDGDLVLEPFSFDEPTSTQRKTIEIPRQTVHGLWLDITEVQPVTLPFTISTFGRMSVASRLVRLAPRFTRAR
jgi:hypothetical protein